MDAENAQPQMNQRISLTQEEVTEQKKVEVYSFDVPVSLPTVRFFTSQFLYNLLGQSADPILISPTGGWARPSYNKPIDKLRVDTGSDGCFIGKIGSPYKFKSTQEDTLRYWILRNPEFIKELTNNGWLFFEEPKEVLKYDKEKLGIEAEKVAGRSFKLENLIKVIETSDHGDRDYSLLLKDLKELTPFGKDMNFVYEVGSSSDPFFHMHVNYAYQGFELKLGQTEKSISPRENREEPNTLLRVIDSEVDFSETFPARPSWWTEEMTDRVHKATIEYLQVKKIQNYIENKKDKSGLKIKVRNRDYAEIVQEPNTKILLENVIKSNQFARQCVGFEHQYHNEEQEKIHNALRRKINETFVF